MNMVSQFEPENQQQAHDLMVQNAKTKAAPDELEWLKNEVHSTNTRAP